MKDLDTIEKRVRHFLLHEKETRDNDMLLYLRVCNSYLLGAGSMSFAKVMQNYKDMGLPNFESVGRTRRKLQADYPELAGSLRVQKLKAQQEQRYRDYAKK